MLFNSYEFLTVFLPLTLIACWMAERMRGRSTVHLVLVFASFAFYCWWDVRFVTLLAGSILFNFWIADPRRIGSYAVFATAVGVNLFVLFVFKYLVFFARDVIGLDSSQFTLENIVLPLGISFFTFQQIAFLCDIRARTIERPRFKHYVLFIAFFPQLIAGPIVRAIEFLPQLSGPRRRVIASDISVGFAIFAIGLCKKTLLADRFAIPANDVFAAASAGDEISLLAAWGGALAFSLQIYFDFSGYSDMAIGLARMVGFRLPENFRSPYKSCNLIDFWRRWHITLSRFLREYLYNPLGGNRGTIVGRYRNLLIVMLLGGLWHGAAWTFIVWGCIHGVGLTLNHLWVRLRRRFFASVPRSIMQIPGWLIAQSFVLVAWVFFRAADLSSATAVLHAMAGGNGIIVPVEWLVTPALRTALSDFAQPLAAIPHFHGAVQLSMLSLGVFVLLCLPNTAELMQHYRVVIAAANLPEIRRPMVTWRPTSGWAIATAVVFCLGVLGMSHVNEFIYFQF